ncbi:MAG: hypothetical protein ABIP03_01050 [Aquihabitans sp.]
MTNDPINRYLTERSSEIHLPDVGASVIVARAKRRRHRRQTGRLAVLASVAVLGGVFVSQAGRDSSQDVHSLGSAVVESTFDWTVVNPNQGLGSSDSTVAVGGALYSLSTAPGTSGNDSQGNQPKRLYRSVDGNNWSGTDLPEHLWAAGLAVKGDQLYAVGTAPAGGGTVALKVASSAAGSAWTQSDLPLDMGELGRGFPGKVVAGRPAIATHGNTTVVAVPVHGTLDPAKLALAGDGWSQTETGMDRYELGQSDPAVNGSSSSTTSSPTAADATTPEIDYDSAADVPVESRTWAELDLSAEAKAIATGRTYLFSSVGSGSFEPVGVRTTGSAQTPALVAAEGGFWLVDGTVEGRSTALLSADGKNWSGVPVALPGFGTETGLIGGRPAVLTFHEANPGPSLTVMGLSLTIIEATGPVTTDLATALGIKPEYFGWSGHAFGPLGMALVTSGPSQGDERVVYTADGKTFATQALPPAPAGKRQGVNGVTVTADAIKVRLNLRPATDEFAETTPAQRLFVGTPR